MKGTTQVYGNTVNAPFSVTNGQQYAEYIQYNTAENAWQFSVNGYQIYTYNSGKNTLVTGTQPNTVIECNDFNPSDFTSFTKQVGQWYISGGTIIFEGALMYQYNNGESTPGNWHPYYDADPCMAAYVYEGGSPCSAWGKLALSSEGPPTSNPNLGIGIQNPSTSEILQFGHGSGFNVPATGTTLWTAYP